MLLPSSSQAPLTILPFTQRQPQCCAPERASLRHARIATAVDSKTQALLALDGLHRDKLNTGYDTLAQHTASRACLATKHWLRHG